MRADPEQRIGHSLRFTSFWNGPNVFRPHWRANKRQAKPFRRSWQGCLAYYVRKQAGIKPDMNVPEALIILVAFSRFVM